MPDASYENRFLITANETNNVCYFPVFFISLVANSLNFSIFNLKQLLTGL